MGLLQKAAAPIGFSTFLFPDLPPPLQTMVLPLPLSLHTYIHRFLYLSRYPPNRWDVPGGQSPHLFPLPVNRHGTYLGMGQELSGLDTTLRKLYFTPNDVAMLIDTWDDE